VAFFTKDSLWRLVTTCRANGGTVHWALCLGTSATERMYCQNLPA
jgi:hypothetical protein